MFLHHIRKKVTMRIKPINFSSDKNTIIFKRKSFLFKKKLPLVISELEWRVIGQSILM